MPKHLIIANDLAGMGNVALSPSLVIMATCQIETSILPTVILSSHTGGFSDIFVEDYGHQAKEFLKQWEQIERPYHAILTGYFKSSQLVDDLIEFAEKKQLPLIVDPILGDRGRLYQGFDQKQVRSMKGLAERADLLVPNLTEAAFLTGRDYLGDTYRQIDVEELLLALSDLGPQHIILTGVSFNTDEIGVAYLDVASGQVHYQFAPKYPYHFFGTGDLFTSIVTAFYIQGWSLGEGIRVAVSFLAKAIKTTLDLGRDLKYGLYFEPHLGDLIKEIMPFLEGKNDEY